MRAKRPAKRNIGIDLLESSLRLVSVGLAEIGETAVTTDMAMLPGAASPKPAIAADTASFDDERVHRHDWRLLPATIVSNDGTAVPPELALLDSGEGTARSDESPEAFVLIHGDAIRFLRSYQFTGNEFVYCDPPYLFSSRRSQRQLYEHEFGSSEEHEGLLDLLKEIPSMVAVSGYWSELYNDELAKWRVISWAAMTRGGAMAREFLWMNYPEPRQLHEYTYLGDDFRERERIRRKAERWVRRFTSLPDLERLAILDRLQDAGIILQQSQLGGA